MKHAIWAALLAALLAQTEPPAMDVKLAVEAAAKQYLADRDAAAYEATLRDLIAKQAPAQIVATRELAGHLVNQGRFREAADLYGEALAKSDDRDGDQLAAAQIQALTRGGFHDEAEARVTDARERFGAGLIWDLLEIESLAARGQDGLEAAFDKLAAAEARHGDDWRLRSARADLLWRSGQRNEAVAFYETFKEMIPRQAVVRMLEHYQQTEQHEKLVELGKRIFLEQAVASGMGKGSPQAAAQAGFMVAQALMRLERYREAAEALQASIKLDPANKGARLTLASLYASKLGRVEDAARLAEDAIAQHPEEPGWYGVLAAARSKQGRHREAVEAAQVAVDLQPTPATLVALARYQQAAGEHEPAQETLRHAREMVSPDDGQSLAAVDDELALAKLATGEADTSDAAVREAALRALKNRVRDGVSEADLRVLRAMAENDDEQHSVLRTLADLLFALNRSEEAADAYARLAEVAAEDEAVHLRFVEASLRAERYEAARRQLDAVLAEFGSSEPTAKLDVVLLLTESKFAEAAAAARRGNEQHGPSAVWLDLEAQALLRAGDTAGAMRSLEEALALEPANAVLRRRAVALAAAMGDRAKAIGIAKAAPDPAALDATTWNHVAQALQLEGRAEEAAAAYRRVVELAPEAAGALNNLAYLLAETLDRPEEALPYARRAVALAKDNASVLDTLGVVYELLGQNFEAIVWLQRSIAADSLPENNLHLARVLIAADRHSEAAEALDRAEELATQANNEAVLQEAAALRAKLDPAER